MTELTYQKDSYLREADAVITRVEGANVFLNRTIFHPRTGGLDHDIGKLIKHDGEALDVVAVYLDKATGDVAHEVTPPEHGLRVGEVVTCVLNWERRYRLMRLHTASHILAAIMWRDHGALITGGHITPEKAYDDYSLQTTDKTIFEEAITKANEVIKKALPVKIYWLPREEALKIPGIIKLAGRTPPPDVKELRIVEIPGIDIQADGGPHVKNTSEIGEIKLLKITNKGKQRKRIYFTVTP